VGHICPVVGFDTIKKFVGLTHLIKPVLQERVISFFINMSKVLSTAIDNVKLFLNMLYNYFCTCMVDFTMHEKGTLMALKESY
jgi:hypothetical protein